MKEETKVKIKNTWEKAKIPVIVTGTGVAAFVLGGKYTLLCCANGLEKFHNAGVLKFFNPETALEVAPEEALNIIKDMVKNKKI